MQVTHKIDVHLDKNQLIAPVDVMQGDAYTRRLEISLYFAGEKWPVPEGASIVIGYFGASGRGAYNDLPDGSPPYTVADNVITVTLIPQVTAAFGVTFVTVVFMDDTGKQIATFGVQVRAARNAALGAGKPQDHYNLKDWVGAGPFYFNVASNGGVYTADKSYDEIRDEYDAGKETICTLKLVGGETMELPIVKGEADKCIFSAVCGGIAKQATITRGEDGAAVVAVEDLPPVLLVTVTRYSIDSNIFYEVDTTFAAIRQAYDNNRVVVCKQGSITMPIAAISGSTAIFSSIRTTNIGERMVHECKITKGNQADTITYTENKLAYKDDLRPPLYVTVTGSGSGTANTSVADIKTAHEQGRAVYCVNGNYILTLVSVDDSKAVFQANDGVSYRWVQIKSDGKVTLVTGTAASTSDLASLRGELEPLYVTVSTDDESSTGYAAYKNIGTAESPYYEKITAAEIKAADDAGRVVLCRYANRILTLDIRSNKNHIVNFSCVHKGVEHRIAIEDEKVLDDNGNPVIENGDYVYNYLTTYTKIDLATEAELHSELYPATDEIYFNITSGGIISLKSEYRGACGSKDYTYGISDNGIGLPGTRNKELPEEIVIPETVGGIPVTALAVAMFMSNTRVKRIILPQSITAIPKVFCARAHNLEEILRTENVKTMDESAFAFTWLRKAYFPKLTTLNGDKHFLGCVNLVTANLGNVFATAPATIPFKCFSACERLEEMRNASGVTRIEESGLYLTYRLKNKDFLPKLTYVGKHGLFLSRADYDWEKLPNYSKFGELSTPHHINKYDYSGCTFQKCHNPIRSTFDQHNPLWTDKYIVNYTDEKGHVEAKYSGGCMVVSAAMAYSALMGVDMESPEEFVEAVRQANPDLLKVDPTDGIIGTDWNKETRVEDTERLELRAWLDAVGLHGEFYGSVNPANMQEMYDQLKKGAYVIMRGPGDNSEFYTNHCNVIHGVNENGELLVVNPSSTARYCEKYGDAISYAMPVQNMMRDAEGAAATNNTEFGEDWFIVVTKK